MEDGTSCNANLEESILDESKESKSPKIKVEIKDEPMEDGASGNGNLGELFPVRLCAPEIFKTLICAPETLRQQTFNTSNYGQNTCYVCYVYCVR